MPSVVEPCRSLRRLPALALVLTLAAASSMPAQGLPAGPAVELGFSPTRLARHRHPASGPMWTRGGCPGAVAIVARHGRVAWSGAFGMADREAARPMTPDALFRIASQSKAITSVAAMILVEEGRLRLNEPVSKYIPSFANARVAVATDSGRILVPAHRAITIHQLLTQTAGLSYGTDSLIRDDYRAAGLGPAAGYGWYLADKAEPVCTTMDRLGTLPLAAQPGEVWIYGYATRRARVRGGAGVGDAARPVLPAADLRATPDEEYLVLPAGVRAQPPDGGLRRHPRRHPRPRPGRRRWARATTSTARGRTFREARAWCPPRATTPASSRCS